MAELPNDEIPATSSFEDSGLSLNDPTNETVALNSFEDSVFVWHHRSISGIQNVTIDQDPEKTSNGFNGSGSPNGKILISFDETTQQNPMISLVEKSSNNLSSIQLNSADRKLNSTNISSTTTTAIIIDEEINRTDLMDDAVGIIAGANRSNNEILKLLDLSEIPISSEVSQAPTKIQDSSSSYGSYAGNNNNSESIVLDEQKMVSFKFDNNDSKEPVSSGSEWQSNNLLEIAFTKTPQTSNSSDHLGCPLLLMDMEQNIKEAGNSLKTPVDDEDSPEKDLKFSTGSDGSTPLIDVVFGAPCPITNSPTTLNQSTGTVPIVGNLLDISTSEIAADKIKIDARISPTHLREQERRQQLQQQQQLDYKSKNLLDLSLEQIEMPVEICSQINPVSEEKLNQVKVLDNMMKDDKDDDENVQQQKDKSVSNVETSLIDLNNAFCDSLLEISLPTTDDLGAAFDHDDQLKKAQQADLEPNIDRSSVARIKDQPETVVDENHHKSSEPLSVLDGEEASKLRSPFIQLDANRIMIEDENKTVKPLDEKKEKLVGSVVSSEKKSAQGKIPRLRPPSVLRRNNTNRFGFQKLIPSRTKSSSIPTAARSISKPNTLANGLEVTRGISGTKKMTKLNNGSRLPTLKR